MTDDRTCSTCKHSRSAEAIVGGKVVHRGLLNCTQYRVENPEAILHAPFANCFHRPVLWEPKGGAC